MLWFLDAKGLPTHIGDFFSQPLLKFNPRWFFSVCAPRSVSLLSEPAGEAPPLPFARLLIR